MDLQTILTTLLVLNIVFLAIRLNKLQKKLNKIILYIEDLNFIINSNYYDFLNYLHKHVHLKEDEKGRVTPFKTTWTEEEEIRVLKFKQWLDEQSAIRGLPIIQTQPLDITSNQPNNLSD